MAFKTDNLGRIIHDASGLVVGYKDGRGNDIFQPITLAQSGVAASVTGTTAETVLASIAIPGGLLGGKGSIRVTPVWTYTNSANNKNLNVKFGGQPFVQAVQTGTSSFVGIHQIRNRSAGAQIMGVGASWNGVGTTGGAVISGTVDTTVDQVLTITAQLASAGETITLEGYTVEVLPS